MALSTKRAMFTFNWSLENFSMCTSGKGEPISSPSFTVDELCASKWHLELYPRGDDAYNSVACYLCRSIAGKWDAEIIAIKYSIEIVCDNGKPIEPTPKSFQLGSRWGIKLLEDNFDVFEKKSDCFPNDVLTIQCRLWKTREIVSSYWDMKNSLISQLFPEAIEVSTPLSESQLYATIAEAKLANKKQYIPNELSVRTRIELERRSVTWSIDRFSEMQAKEKKFLVVPSADSSCSSLVIAFCATENCDYRIEIERSLIKTQMCVKFKIIFLDQQGKVKQAEAEHQYLFTDDKKGIWIFPVKIYYMKEEEILEDDVLLLQNDVFHLRCEFVISYKGKVSNTFGVTSFPDCPDFSTQHKYHYSNNKAFLRVFEDKKFCDVKLHVGEKSFSAHRAVLYAFSPVFAAMFDSEMKEKNSGEVHITDVDYGTLERLLKFFYFNDIQLEEIGLDEVCALYSAANKYQVLNLKMICSNFLKYKVRDKNVCDILSLADAHQDQTLKKTAVELIATNSRTIFLSEDWKYFLEKSPKLAACVMHEILVLKYINCCCLSGGV